MLSHSVVALMDALACLPASGWACQQVGRASTGFSVGPIGTPLDVALKLWLCVHCVFLSTINSLLCKEVEVQSEHHSQKDQDQPSHHQVIPGGLAGSLSELRPLPKCQLSSSRQPEATQVGRECLPTQ